MHFLQQFFFVIFILLFSESSIASEKTDILTDYLLANSQLEADFIQISSDGSESRGKLLIKRPGKLMWRYIEPVKMDILIKNKLVTIYDYDLEQYSYARFDNIFSDFFLNPNSDLIHKQLKKINENSGYIEYILKISEGDMQGEFAVTLQKFPTKLKKLEYTDINEEKNSIIIENLKEKELSDRLFIINEKKRRNR